MKTIMKKMPLAAFVFAIVAAFAFNDRATVWYPVDEHGDIINNPLGAPPIECIEGPNYCAVRMDDTEFTGAPPIENVEDDDPDNLIKEVLYKE